jgi:hypothetical protein
MEKIVVARRQIKQIAGGDARRIAVVVFLTRFWQAYQG